LLGQQNFPIEPIEPIERSSREERESLAANETSTFKLLSLYERAYCKIRKMPIAEDISNLPRTSLTPLNWFDQYNQSSRLNPSYDSGLLFGTTFLRHLEFNETRHLFFLFVNWNFGDTKDAAERHQTTFVSM
jgi:hypothetical protein